MGSGRFQVAFRVVDMRPVSAVKGFSPITFECLNTETVKENWFCSELCSLMKNEERR
jgi:hypothetical protein